MRKSNLAATLRHLAKSRLRHLFLGCHSEVDYLTLLLVQLELIEVGLLLTEIILQVGLFLERGEIS